MGKYWVLWVKKSNKIWNGQASIGKAKSLFNLYAIKINTNATTRLCEKLYSENTHSGISANSGFPNFKLNGLDTILYKKKVF